MQEAVLYVTPYQVRLLLATILINSNVSNARKLWNNFSVSLTEDYTHAGNDKHSSSMLALIHIKLYLETATINFIKKFEYLSRCVCRKVNT